MMEKKQISTICDDLSGVNINQATKQGYIFCPVGGLFDASYPNSKLRRGRVQGGGKITPTLTCNPDCLWFVDSINENYDENGMKIKNVRFRKLTERECFRLMGVPDKMIDTLLESNEVSRSQMYKMAGNSIAVPVLKNIFRTLFVEENSEVGQSNKLF